MSEMRVELPDYDDIKQEMMELEITVEQTVTLMNLLALVLDGDVFAGTDDLEFLIETWMTLFTQMQDRVAIGPEDDDDEVSEAS